MSQLSFGIRGSGSILSSSKLSFDNIVTHISPTTGVKYPVSLFTSGEGMIYIYFDTTCVGVRYTLGELSCNTGVTKQKNPLSDIAVNTNDVLGTITSITTSKNTNTASLRENVVTIVAAGYTFVLEVSPWKGVQHTIAVTVQPVQIGTLMVVSESSSDIKPMVLKNTLASFNFTNATPSFFTFKRVSGFFKIVMFNSTTSDISMATLNGNSNTFGTTLGAGMILPGVVIMNTTHFVSSTTASLYNVLTLTSPSGVVLTITTLNPETQSIDGDVRVDLSGIVLNPGDVVSVKVVTYV